MFSDRSATAEEPDALERALSDRRTAGAPLLDVRIDHAPLANDRVVTSSAPLLAPLLLLCDAGDEVLVPEPAETSLDHAAQLAGVSLSPYSLVFEERWRLDPEALWEAIGERTRAIVAISPSGVTGAALSAAELEALAALELPLILDARLAEPPRDPRLDEDYGAVLQLTLRERSITLSGAAPLVAEALERLDAIERALGTRETGEEEADDRVAAAFEALRAELEGSAFDVPRIEAGSRAPVRLPGEDDARWVLALLERDVIATPGRRLGFPEGEAWIVLNLRAGPEAMRRTASALVAISSRGGPGSR